MCGFLGSINSPFRADLSNALSSISSRGPDSRLELDIEDGVWLGHVRLAVIDLSEGKQPMISHDRRFSIVFNGEIFNYRELRGELCSLGFSFRTQSDTEVLLVGHQAWGEKLPSKLDGMFAYAIWDSTQKKLFAARDQIGIKPFFFSTIKGLVFGSTLSPFLNFRGFPFFLNFEAVRDYLGYHVCLSPHTFNSVVRQLPPATQMVWSADGEFQEMQYWNIPAASRTNISFSQGVAEVEEAIRTSVRRQMVSDVPLGAFLSGGVDSSLLAYYMQEHSSTKLKTFSMRFNESNLDESSFATTASKFIGTDHTIIDAPNLSPEVFVRAISALDQPLSDPAYVMTYALSEAAKKSVTVAVAGDGGDELFAGYSRYKVQETDFKSGIGQSFLRAAVKRGLLPGRLAKFTLSPRERMLYRQVDVGPWINSRKSLSAILSTDAYNLCNPNMMLNRWSELVTSWGGSIDTDALIRADLWTYLSENCLTKTDRASMAHGLEVRVPLLGQPVRDLVLSFPADIHFRSGVGKALLRELCHRYLPESIWNRPKHGFSVPIRQLMQTDWREIGDHVVSRVGVLAPWINSATVVRLWKESSRGFGYPNLMYSILVLLIWLEAKKISVSSSD
jgi:asparagine synthase (glutamine-hydrolysing)